MCGSGVWLWFWAGVVYVQPSHTKFHTCARTHPPHITHTYTASRITRHRQDEHGRSARGASDVRTWPASWCR